MNYQICATTSKQRDSAKGEYIAVINRSVKSREKIGKYAVVKFLFFNEKGNSPEYREMLAIAKIVIDNSLPDDCICIDQSIRNAIGIPFGSLAGVNVNIAPMKLNLLNRIYDFIYKGNCAYARVHKPDVIDIEKNYCRMKSDTIQVLGAIEGKAIIIEKPVSSFELRVGGGFSNLPVDDDEEFFKIVAPYKKQINEIDFTNFLGDKGNQAGCEYILSCIKDNSIMEKDKKLLLNSLFEICDWNICSPFIRISMSVPVFPLQKESFERMNSIMKAQNEISFYSRYPDAEKIFSVNPDISSIYLDKYYRDKLRCDLLDCVRVKRNRIAVIMNEIMDYGLTFVISVVAVMLSFFGQNRFQNLLSVMVALVVTTLIIRQRTK